MRTISELAPWLMIAIGFVFFAAISAGCRFALARLASPERSSQLEGHADKLLGVFGATFAFLVGFAITITWSAVGAGQDAVDLQASSAQQLSWAAGEIQDKAGADEVNGNLRNYLQTVVNKDGPALRMGISVRCPLPKHSTRCRTACTEWHPGKATRTRWRAEWYRRLHH